MDISKDTNTFHPVNKEILLGTENKNSVIINVLIILAKYYIYKCLQQKEYPTIRNFQNNVKTFLTLEETAATTNNKLEEFRTLWQNLLMP